MKKCPYCGKESKTNQEFCKCGYYLMEDIESDEKQHPTNYELKNKGEDEEAYLKKNIKRVFEYAIIPILILIVYKLIVFFIGSKNETTGNDKEWLLLNENGFCCSFPFSPIKEKDTLYFENKEIAYYTSYAWVSKNKSLDEKKGYSCSYIDYPINFGIHSDSIHLIQSFFDNGISNSVKMVQGVKLPGCEIISLNGYPGREYWIEVYNGKVLLTNRMYLVKNRLYILSIINSKKESSILEKNRFFESFNFEY